MSPILSGGYWENGFGSCLRRQRQETTRRLWPTEAMACGCPIVASTAGACPETTAGAALLADPHDPEDFARQMLHVLSDEALRAELRDRGFERAAVFSWEGSARTVLDALEEVAGQARTVSRRPNRRQPDAPTPDLAKRTHSGQR